MNFIDFHSESIFDNDLLDIVKAFYPYIVLSEKGSHLDIKTEISSNVCKIIINYIDIYNNHKETIEKEEIFYGDLLEIKRKFKRFCKNNLYKFLSEKFKVNLPYGSITGVRPTCLYYQLEKEGLNALSELKSNYYVDAEKADLIAEIVKNQRDIVFAPNKNLVDFYVNIPICTTRCSYCSFLSSELRSVKGMLDSYVANLKREIEISLKLLREKGIGIKTVYFGGGTPTSLSADNLRTLINLFDKSGICEFTVEAGRADTIDDEKLRVLSVIADRISINPQTFNDKTLREIGRSASVSDFYRAYEIACKYPFLINMDLIAALPGENEDDFAYSLDKAIELRPENLTVHTLALKRGSRLMENDYVIDDWNVAGRMINHSYEAMQKAGYFPYYMYRQKNCAGGHENVGYALKKPCIYNIDMMEECLEVIACGAGGISKKFFSGGRIERFANLKGIKEYINNFEEMLNKKIKFFESEK